MKKWLIFKTLILALSPSPSHLILNSQGALPFMRFLAVPASEYEGLLSDPLHEVMGVREAMRLLHVHPWLPTTTSLLLSGRQSQQPMTGSPMEHLTAQLSGMGNAMGARPLPSLWPRPWSPSIPPRLIFLSFCQSAVVTACPASSSSKAHCLLPGNPIYPHPPAAVDSGYSNYILPKDQRWTPTPWERAFGTPLGQEVGTIPWA